MLAREAEQVSYPLVVLYVPRMATLRVKSRLSTSRRHQQNWSPGRLSMKPAERGTEANARGTSVVPERVLRYQSPAGLTATTGELVNVWVRAILPPIITEASAKSVRLPGKHEHLISACTWRSTATESIQNSIPHMQRLRQRRLVLSKSSNCADERHQGSDHVTGNMIRCGPICWLHGRVDLSCCFLDER